MKALFILVGLLSHSVFADSEKIYPDEHNIVSEHDNILYMQHNGSDWTIKCSDGSEDFAYGDSYSPPDLRYNKNICSTKSHRVVIIRDTYLNEKGDHYSDVLLCKLKKGQVLRLDSLPKKQENGSYVISVNNRNARVLRDCKQSRSGALEGAVSAKDVFLINTLGEAPYYPSYPSHPSYPKPPSYPSYPNY